MAVYVDQSRNNFGRMIMCHMIADTLDELHAMADRLGLQRRWFQENASTPHYDVSLGKRLQAMKLGAISVNRREMVAVIKRLRAERNAGADCTPASIDQPQNC